MPAVLYEKRGPVALITINRPEALNAMNLDVRRGLNESLRAFDADPELGAAIITGAGERAFCAGADLKELRNRLEGADEAPDERTAINKGQMYSKPIIAAIRGYCLAGGMEMALACDIRIAAEDAVFALTEVTRGIIPAGGGTQRLPRLVPFGIALEMMLTANRIDAREAHRIGLVNHVVPPAELMPAALALAERICRNAPLSVRATKKLVYQNRECTLSDGLLEEQRVFDGIRNTEDAKEGPRAFVEKREARWQGR